MRFLGIFVAVFAFVQSSGAQAQSWVSYLGVQDRFAIWFPVEPTVEATEWIDENGNARPARSYRAERNGDIFTVIAVDYSDADFNMLKGAYPHAATVYRQKGVVTYDGYSHTDRVDGHRLQVTLEDGRRIYFLTHLYDGILYILDANVSPRSAPPGRFEQGLQLLDKDGERVRFDQQGNRMPRTDDLHDVLGGPDLDGPIPSGFGDTTIPQ